jgi:hypothetical protein
MIEVLCLSGILFFIALVLGMFSKNKKDEES